MLAYGSPRGPNRPDRTDLQRRREPICFLRRSPSETRPPPTHTPASVRPGPDSDAPDLAPGSARFGPPLSRAFPRGLATSGCGRAQAAAVLEGGPEKMSGDGGFAWTVVVLTCQHKDSVYAFQRGERPRGSARKTRHPTRGKRVAPIVGWTFTHLRDVGEFRPRLEFLS